MVVRGPTVQRLAALHTQMELPWLMPEATARRVTACHASVKLMCEERYTMWLEHGSLVHLHGMQPPASVCPACLPLPHPSPVARVPLKYLFVCVCPSREADGHAVIICLQDSCWLSRGGVMVAKHISASTVTVAQQHQHKPA